MSSNVADLSAARVARAASVDRLARLDAYLDACLVDGTPDGQATFDALDPEDRRRFDALYDMVSKRVRDFEREAFESRLLGVEAAIHRALMLYRPAVKGGAS